MQETQVTFEIRNLSFSYPEQEAKAIKDLTLSVQQGELLCSAALPAAAKVRCSAS